MARLGFIHEKLDIKILILFILRRLPGEVEPETLCELCQCDGGIDYFDYSDCLSDLIETEHIKETPTGYTITDKGAKNAEAVESSLPYSVRMKALKLLAPVEERLRGDDNGAPRGQRERLHGRACNVRRQGRDNPSASAVRR